MVSGSDTVVGGMCVGAAMDLLLLVCSVNALLDDHLGSLKDGTGVSMNCCCAQSVVCWKA